MPAVPTPFRRPSTRVPALRVASWVALSLMVGTTHARAQPTELFRSWNQPVEAFHIVGNVYYVGASDIASYLITTPEGHILLEGGFAETAPLIEKSVRDLGFKLDDVRLLITSHAHFDHAGGLAELKRLSGARLAASAAEAEMLARGGTGDFQHGDKLPFPAVVADQIVGDGDTVELGGVVLTAHITPGHTKGCTTWTMRTAEGESAYDIVFMASLTTPGYDLRNNPQYPDIAGDLFRSFEILRGLPCDVFLAPHGFAFSLKRKRARLGSVPNPFIDPSGYRVAIDNAERDLRKNLQAATAKPATQTEAAPKPGR